MTKNACMRFILYSFMPIMMFYSHIILMYWKHFVKLVYWLLTWSKTKMMAMKAIQPRHYPKFTYKGVDQYKCCKKYLDINVPSTNRWNIILRVLTSKWVGTIIICLKINTIKALLEDGKWDWCYSMLWWSKCCFMVHQRLWTRERRSSFTYGKSYPYSLTQLKGHF